MLIVSHGRTTHGTRGIDRSRIRGDVVIEAWDDNQGSRQKGLKLTAMIILVGLLLLAMAAVAPAQTRGRGSAGVVARSGPDNDTNGQAAEPSVQDYQRSSSDFTSDLNDRRRSTADRDRQTPRGRAEVADRIFTYDEDDWDWRSYRGRSLYGSSYYRGDRDNPGNGSIYESNRYPAERRPSQQFRDRGWDGQTMQYDWDWLYPNERPYWNGAYGQYPAGRERQFQRRDFDRNIPTYMQRKPGTWEPEKRPSEQGRFAPQTDRRPRFEGRRDVEVIPRGRGMNDNGGY